MKQVDELIRGEISAIESIDAVLKRINDESERQTLSSLRSDHIRAVDTLKRFSSGEVKGETNSSGPWGAFATAFAGGASFFGDKAAIQALKVGEEHGRQEYQEALESRDIRQDLRQVIQTELLPQQERHLNLINRYIQ